jgi:hypothetical protein
MIARILKAFSRPADPVNKFAAGDIVLYKDQLFHIHDRHLFDEGWRYAGHILSIEGNTLKFLTTLTGAAESCCQSIGLEANFLIYEVARKGGDL